MEPGEPEGKHAPQGRRMTCAWAGSPGLPEAELVQRTVRPDQDRRPACGLPGADGQMRAPGALPVQGRARWPPVG